MFRIKICGITTIDDALAAAKAGADALGLNFYSGSPRFVAVDIARQIASAAPSDVRKVGVFVNAGAAEIRATVDAVGLDIVQLHGDEPPELLRDLSDLKVVRALRPAADLQAVTEYLDRCSKIGVRPAMLLLDAYAQAQYGGTGDTADWQAIKTGQSAWGGLPLVLAGGLKPENVAAAIECVRPAAVDTASGVEISPGRKSAERMHAFVLAAREAFERFCSSG